MAVLGILFAGRLSRMHHFQLNRYSRIVVFSYTLLSSASVNSFELDQTSFSALRQLNYQSPTLLVVEDQDDIWLLLTFFLAKCFPDVFIHRTANRADTVDYIRQGVAGQVSLPKLILQDLYLPERADGLGLLADIQQLLSGHQRIPTLVMSSSIAPEDVQLAYRAHASYYLAKPLELSQWLNLCRSLHQFWWDQGALPIYIATESASSQRSS